MVVPQALCSRAPTATVARVLMLAVCSCCGVLAAAPSTLRRRSDASLWPAAAQISPRTSFLNRMGGRTEEGPRAFWGLLHTPPVFRLLLRGGQAGGEPFGWEQGEGCDVEDWKRLAEQVPLHARFACRPRARAQTERGSAVPKTAGLVLTTVVGKGATGCR